MRLLSCQYGKVLMIVLKWSNVTPVTYKHFPIVWVIVTINVGLTQPYSNYPVHVGSARLSKKASFYEKSLSILLSANNYGIVLQSRTSVDKKIKRSTGCSYSDVYDLSPNRTIKINR